LVLDGGKAAQVMARVILITGGARSGKSSLALDLAERHGSRRAFVATMEPLDEELKERVLRHKRERDDAWETFEVPVDVASVLGRISGKFDAVVIDCLTLWLSNVMVAGGDVEGEMEGLLNALREARGTVYVVSNEIGMGIVPDNGMAREFRDIAGRLNQRVASEATEAYLSVSGIPVRIKPEA
jgi:adenosylcobinamide kinase/adenosylcobinamide-phosphate guanylyltransferase